MSLRLSAASWLRSFLFFVMATIATAQAWASTAVSALEFMPGQPLLVCKSDGPTGTSTCETARPSHQMFGYKQAVAMPQVYRSGFGWLQASDNRTELCILTKYKNVYCQSLETSITAAEKIRLAKITNERSVLLVPVVANQPIPKAVRRELAKKFASKLTAARKALNARIAGLGETSNEPRKAGLKGLDIRIIRVSLSKPRSSPVARNSAMVALSSCDGSFQEDEGECEDEPGGDPGGPDDDDGSGDGNDPGDDGDGGDVGSDGNEVSCTGGGSGPGCPPATEAYRKCVDGADKLYQNDVERCQEKHLEGTVERARCYSNASDDYGWRLARCYEIN